MQTIFLKPTNKCNLSCKHCFVDKQIKSIPNYFERVTSFLKDIPYRNMEIIMHGGEPMMLPCNDIKNFYSDISRYHNVMASIQTNLAYELTDEKIALFKDVFGSYIGTSLDTTGRFKTNKDFENWKDNILLLKKEEISVSLCFCLTKETMKEWLPYDLLNFCDEHSIKTLTIERATGEGDYLPEPEDVDDYLYDLFHIFRSMKYFRRFKIPMFSALIRNFTEPPRGVFCRDCQERVLTINANGTISGCPNNADIDIWGHIDDGAESFLSSSQKKCAVIKEKIRNTECYECKYFSACNGDCHQLSKCYAPKKIMRDVGYIGEKHFWEII